MKEMSTACRQPRKRRRISHDRYHELLTKEADLAVLEKQIDGLREILRALERIAKP